jgi:hypothetical protein
MVNPIWKGIAGKTTFSKMAFGIRLPGDAGGGVKICTADNVTIRNLKSFDNGGPGLWFDVYVKNIVVTSPECYSNHFVVPGQPWEAAGVAVEICDGPTLIENAYSHDNTGSDYAVWESNNVTLRNCIAGTKGIEVRDLGGDRGAQGWLNKNVLFDGVKFYGAAKINYWPSLNPAVRQQRNIVESNLTFGLAGVPAWTGDHADDAARPSAAATRSRKISYRRRGRQLGIVSRAGERPGQAREERRGPERNIRRNRYRRRGWDFLPKGGQRNLDAQRKRLEAGRNAVASCPCRRRRTAGSASLRTIR